MYRYAFLFLTFSTLLICFFSCSTMSQDVVIESNEESEIRIYEVFGMN
jgi:hypothetical protein